MTRPVEREVVRQVLTPHEWGRTPANAFRAFWFVHDRAHAEREWLEQMESNAAQRNYPLRRKMVTP